jgi:hypothetical protein
MISNIARAVRFVSNVHGTTSSLRRGERTVDDVVRSTLFSREYFPTFLGVSMTFSFVGGFNYMEVLKTSRIPTSAAHAVV